MSEYQKKYQDALKLERKYRDAPRTGWVRPNSRKRENQAIQVSREEAAELAWNYAIQLSVSWATLNRCLTLETYIENLATNAPNHTECETCGKLYVPVNAYGVCPFCKAEEKALKATDALRERDAPDSGKAAP